MAIQTLPQPQLSDPATDVRQKILIVDDDPMLLDVLAQRLRRQGFETSLGHTGQEALQAVRTEHPHLVLLDLGLPDMNGLEVCEILTEKPETCHIPIIILSGMQAPDIIRRSRKAGCLYFVRKPYDPNALLILIQQALDESERWNAGSRP